jgi:type IV fimbrial biogenesis protein FimT
MFRRLPYRLRARPRRTQHGFTLVEAVIVITVIGLLASLAGPAFQDFIVRQRIRNAAYDLMVDLTFARSEAVKRNAVVTISRAETWTGGWTITDAAGNTLRRHSKFPDAVAITMSGASIDFLLNGRASAGASFTIDDSAGKSNIPARCIAVDRSGRSRSTQGACA